MKKQFDNYVINCLNNIRHVREHNLKVEKCLMGFLNEDTSIMYYENEKEIEDNFINSIELMINKDAKDVVEYYLSECLYCDFDGVIEFDYKDKHLKFNLCNDKDLLKALNKLMKIKEEHK